MKVLLFGADGFIGNTVLGALRGEHEVVGAIRSDVPDEGYVLVDLLDRASISAAIKQVKPDIIISCAGVVENTEKADANPVFTGNILDEAKASGLVFKRIVISGSAAEFGLVDPSNIPVNEDAPLNANAGYGLSKVREEQVALAADGLPVVVARIFNPIGSAMHPRFLIPKLISQLEEVKAGERDAVEVSRLDSKRDYIDVRDVASAIISIATGEPTERVYNVGSGVATSNGELIELILEELKLDTKPAFVETSESPEALVAIQADISRIKDEFGWSPAYDIKDTVKEIVDAPR